MFDHLFATLLFLVFFFNDTATPEIYTLSLHDALPICLRAVHETDAGSVRLGEDTTDAEGRYTIRYELLPGVDRDRKSTRLNSSHSSISYAVFCLKKKININQRLIFEL